MPSIAVAPDPTRPSAEDFWTRWLADQPYFRRMCVRWLRGNRQEAEDVLSRGSLRALEYLRRHPGGVERFRPWILRILFNLCLDTVRAAGRCVAEPDEGGDAPALTAPGASPDRAVYCDELRGALSGAFASLPPRLSVAFSLRVLDDLEYDDICRRLGITPENARKRVQQARARLRDRLAAVA